MTPNPLPAGLVTGKTARLPGDLKKQPDVTPKRSKYGNVKVELDGYVFDSKREAERYGELKLLAKAGKISALDIHPVYRLCDPVRWNGRVYPAIRYVADFSYIENGREVVEDVKGVKTAAYRLKRHFFLLDNSEVDFREIQ